MTTKDWKLVEFEDPKIKFIGGSYVSDYVEIKTFHNEICIARLEGSSKDNLFWYEENGTGDQIDDVIYWRKLNK